MSRKSERSQVEQFFSGDIPPETDTASPVVLPACTGEEGAEAVLRFGATHDQMKAGITCYTPAADGRPLTVEDLRARLEDSGVTFGFDSDAAERAVALLNAGESAARVVLARGRPPRDAAAAAVRPLLDLARPVRPGMTFAERIPPLSAAEGVDVAGNPVVPAVSDPPADLFFPEDAHCFVDDDGRVIAEAYGLAEVVGTEVRVRPLFTVSADRVSLTGAFYPADAAGEPLDASFALDELERMGVTMEVDRAAVSRAVAAAVREGRPVAGVPLAQGEKPRHGGDGRLDLDLEERSEVGTVRADGGVDFRERGVSPSVEEGAVFARLHPPTRGVPGVDVFGREIAARDGRPRPVRAGPGVRAEEVGASAAAETAGNEPDASANDLRPMGGVVEFSALHDGLVMFEEGTLALSELLDVRGDVDFTTGNIRVAHGSVRIHGVVRSSFEVHAPKYVVVEGSVESAVIEAGGDVQVAGGILMDGRSGRIRAGGNVTAAFANNAVIRAGGDVIIGQYITAGSGAGGESGEVRAGGRIVVTEDKGKILGGRLVSGQGIQAAEIGSPLGAPTLLSIRVETDEIRELARERSKLVADLARIEAALGTEGGDKRFERLAARTRERVGDLIRARDWTRRRARQVASRLAEYTERSMDERAGKVRIIISGTAHAGTVIGMGGRTLRLEKAVDFSQFYWDALRHEIVATSL